MSTRARSTSMRAVRHGGRRRSAIATAVALLQAADRRGVLPPLQDLSTGLFWRDRARTQPYTEADKERTVEYVDDLTGLPRGWTLGPDLLGGVGSGSSTAGISSSACTLTLQSGSVLITNTGANGKAFISFPTTVGKRYKVIGTFNTKSAAASAAIREGSGFGTTYATTGDTTNTGRFVVDFVAALTSHTVNLTAVGGAGTTASFSSVTVQEVISDESWLGPNNVPQPIALDQAPWTTRGSLAVLSANSFTNASGVGAGRTLNLPSSGDCYQFEIVFTKSDASTSFGVAFDAAATVVASSTASSGTLSGIAQSGGQFYLRLAGNATVTFSALTVRRIPGNPIVSAVAGSGLVLSRRVNMLQRTTWSGAVAGSPGTGPTGWSQGFWTGALSVPVSGQLEFTVSASRHQIQQSVAVAVNSVYRARVLVVANTGMNVSSILSWNHGALAGTSIQYQINRVNVSPSAIPQAGDELTCLLTVTSTSGTLLPRFGAGCAASDTGTVRLSEPDIRPTFWDQFPGIPSYQRVNDGTAGVLDYDDSTAFPLHWRNITGTQAMMTLGTVDMSAGDAGAMIAGVVKLSDAGGQMIAETSAHAGTNNGAVYVFVPSGGTGYTASSRGTSQVNTSNVGTPAPDVAELLLHTDISDDVMRLSRNGIQIITSSSDQGTGNLGNHRLNIAGRDVGGTASLRFTGILLHLPALVAADAGIDLQALAREYAASSGFTY